MGADEVEGGGVFGECVWVVEVWRGEGGDEVVAGWTVGVLETFESLWTLPRGLGTSKPLSPRGEEG